MSMVSAVGAAGTLALASTPSVIPSDASADFSSINLYDLDGPTTWPITMISYIYIERDLTSMNPTTAGLLLYFVNFILSEEGQALAEQNKFVKLPKKLLDYNAVALAGLLLPQGAPVFTTELASKTLAQTGAGMFVISGKRRSFGEYTGTTNTKAIAALGGGTTGASSLTAGLRAEPVALAGLVMACLAFLIASVAAVIAGVLCCQRNRVSKPRSIEVPVRDLEPPAVSTTTADKV